MRRFLSAVAFFALAGGCLPLPSPASTRSDDSLAALRWRFIGPLRGGRTTSVNGVADDPNLYYIGVNNGGVWKTDDAGRTWAPIFDGEDTGSIGALAVAPSDPNVIYVGSGENVQRPDLAVGDGIYKSTDAGKTWTHLGLRDGQQIGQIAVDQHDSNRLFVAVLGHPYGPNTERGVYRSTDGGATFQRVLYKDENTGAFWVTIDPNHSDTVYATLWAARQAPWEIGSSFEIPNSGIYKSTDGGATWTQLKSGFPAHIGRSVVAVAPSDSSVVYAYADAYNDLDPGGALYRSDDGGAHFIKVNDSPGIAERGDDLATVAVDPVDPNTVYVTNTSTYRSRDGGKTFVAIKGAPGGDDYHRAWINPNHPSDIALASDQGATISVNDGRTWSSWYNQPTAQMYHVSTDASFPYWVCGGQQESGSACVRSRGPWGQTTVRDWHPVGAEEYGYVVPDPLHPGVFFGGKVERFDTRTGQTQEVAPVAVRSKAYRVVRTEPLSFDPLDGHTLYFGANRVYATRDGGMHWRAISPDLTRKHPAVPKVLGPFEASDPQRGAHRGVLYALAPSYTHRGTIWAGTDDGLVWVTRDGGAHWSNVTPARLTPWSKIAQIDASRFDDETAYVAVNRFRLDDQHPYAYRTHDGGKTWHSISTGLPLGPVNAVREDPQVRGLLYAATESGVYVSFDDGARWRSLQQNLPRTSVRDLVIHGDDIAVATHGRGFWILTDIEPLREMARGQSLSATHLFAPSLTYRVRRDTNTDTPLPPEEPHGQNPPDGAIIDYTLASPVQRVRITVSDAHGNVVRAYASDEPTRPPIVGLDKPAWWERPQRRPQTTAGLHRFVWDLHEPRPASVYYDLPISAVKGETPRIPQGALVPPGTYTVRLAAGGHSYVQRLRLVMDPRVRATTAQLLEQYTVAHDLTGLMNRTFAAMTRAQRTKDAKRAAEMGTLNARLGGILDVVEGADAPPTSQALAAYALLRKQTLAALAKP